MAVFPWCWHPWGCKKINMTEPFWDKLFHKETGPFTGSFIQEWTNLFHRGTILNQLDWMCAKTVFGKLSLMQRVKISAAFFHSYAHHFAGCWHRLSSGFLWQSSDKFLQVSWGTKHWCLMDNGQNWYCHRLGSGLDCTVCIVSNRQCSWLGTLVLSLIQCYLFNGKRRGVMGTHSSALTLIAQNFHSPD